MKDATPTRELRIGHVCFASGYKNENRFASIRFIRNNILVEIFAEGEKFQREARGIAEADYSGALAAYQEIIDRWPDTEMALKAGNTKGTLHYNLAGRGIDSIHYNKAIAEYRKVIAHDVDTTNHHHQWKAIVIPIPIINHSLMEVRFASTHVATFKESHKQKRISPP